MLDSLIPNPDADVDSQTLHRFTALCADISADENETLQTRVREHVEYIRGHLRSNEFLDVALAQRIADRLITLLQSSTSYSSQGQRLLVGAAHYFIADEDAESDTRSILGLEDDLAVFNYVAAQLGVPMLKADG